MDKSHVQRNYFPFYDYDYCLDVTEQYKVLPNVINLRDGLKEDFEWYKNNQNEVLKKTSYFDYIKNNLRMYK